MIFVLASDVMNAIQWSEKLNRIFITNYESDPSLGWQYFGSSTGFMRQYPGKSISYHSLWSKADAIFFLE